MQPGGFDPEIVRDFLTESGELVAQLEGDLVSLERAPRDPALLNQAFRALHTIKGSASFLAVTPLVKVAHAAESALNAARNGVVQVDRAAMDLLLEAVDLIKGQLGSMDAGSPLAEPRDALVHGLSAIGEGRSAGHGGAAVEAAASNAAAPAPSAAPAAAPAPPANNAVASTPLSLTGGKADLFEFLLTDLDDSLQKLSTGLEACIGALGGSAGEAAKCGDELAATAEQLARTAEFFEVPTLVTLARLMQHAGENADHLTADQASQAGPRLRLTLAVITHLAEGVRAKELRAPALGSLEERTRAIFAGTELDAAAVLPPGASPGLAAATDGCWAPAGLSVPAHAAVANMVVTPAAPVASTAASVAAAAPTPGEASKSAPAEADARKAQATENTIRVEVSRLEALMNLVGELVLQKNRIAGVARKLAGQGDAAELSEAMTLAAGGLDRVTGDIQAAVMRTRLQPLDKLFGRYPRLIRDLAGKTGKKMRLVVEGGDTEADKSVIEELADPLVHLLRNAADHGLEPPAERVAAGKDEVGTITLLARHEGSHVRVQVQDDGRGLARERIARKAVERGLATEQAVAAMTDGEIFNFIFEAGFSTADQVSDLSGRGVGMDVVRTNIRKIKGTIELSSQPGKGTVVTILIPLTVAILPAMLVGVGTEIYALPLTNILEIVRPQAGTVSTIGERPVMRLRDGVLPLVSASEVLELKPKGGEAVCEPFAVVLTTNGRRVGLTVTRLVGQQEIVIKPLDDAGTSRRRAVSGATVRDDGGVSLIIDVGELVRSAENIRAA